MPLNISHRRCVMCGRPTENTGPTGSFICYECESKKKEHISKGGTEANFPIHRNHTHLCHYCNRPTSHILPDGYAVCKNCEPTHKKEKLSLYTEDLANKKYVCLKCGEPTDGNENGEPICESCEIEEFEKEHGELKNQNTVALSDESLSELEEENYKENSQENDNPEQDEEKEIDGKSEKSIEESGEKNKGEEDKGISQKEEPKKIDYTDTLEPENHNLKTENKNNNFKDSENSIYPNKKENLSSIKDKKDKIPKNKSNVSAPKSPRTSMKGKLEKSALDKSISKLPKKLQESKIAERAKKAQEMKAKIEKIKKIQKSSKILMKILANPVTWQIFLIILIIILFAALITAIIGGIGMQGAKDGTREEYEWDKPEFTEDWDDSEGNRQKARYLTYVDFDPWGFSGSVNGVNYVEKLPDTTIDLSNVNGVNISNVKMPTKESLISWRTRLPYVSTDIETDPNKKWVKGKAMWEMHLPTNKTNPFKSGAFIEIPGIVTNQKSDGYMSSRVNGVVKPSGSAQVGQPGVEWTGGAFGFLEPEVEQWYMNMVWSYNGHYKSYKGKKVLVTNTKTGYMVVCAVGDFGPGSSKNANERHNNQIIAGISPDTAAYLSSGTLNGPTKLYSTTDTMFTFGFLVDQSIPYGPIAVGTAGNSNVVEIARQQIGKAYVWGATGPNTFDCSGLMLYCYKKIGITLPRVSRDQYNTSGGIKITNKSDLQPGDLVFFARPGQPIHHVGMYSGNGNYIHSPRTGDFVKEVKLNTRSDYFGAVRVIKTKEL